MTLQREIHFDPVLEEIIGDQEAADMLDCTRRSPWELPTRKTRAISMEEASPQGRGIAAAKTIKPPVDHMPELKKIQTQYLESPNREQRQRLLDRIRIIANQLSAPVLAYAPLLQSVKDISTQKAILESMGQSCSSRDTLEFALEYMDSYPTVRPNAALAAIRIANAFRHEDVGASIRALEKIRSEVDHDDIHARATAVRVQMELDHWHLHEWMYSGPYHLENSDTKMIHETAFGPEKGEEVEWTPCQIGWLYGRVWNLESAIAPGNHCTAYLRSYIWSDREQIVRFESGASDAVKIWLNEKKIIDQYREGGYQLGMFSSEVPLISGWNELVVKVTNHVGSWEFSGRFCTLDRTGEISGLIAAKMKTNI